MNQLYNLIKPIFAVLSFTIAACSNQLVVQEQQWPEEEIYETTDLVLGSDSVFQCWMSYEYDDGDCMVFYVHLVNYSVLNAMFDPAACYLEYPVNRAGKRSDANLRVYALNPEAEIQYLSAEKQDAEEKNSMALGFNIISAVFDIATNAFDGVTENDPEIVEDVFYWGSNITDNIMIGKEQEEFYNDAESFWKYNVMRRTIVKSGEEVSGLVYFPIQKRSRKFNAVVPFAGTANVYDFGLRRKSAM
jgi:hypothetical protein